MNENNTLIQHKLKEIRKKYKFTQKAVAEALSVDRTTYTYYETGRLNPNFKTIYKLCKIYQVPANYFFEDVAPDSMKLADAANDEDVFFTKFNRKDEQSLLMNFRLLSDEAKEKVIEYIKSLGNEGI